MAHASYSELKEFRRCPRLHHFKYVERRPTPPMHHRRAFVGYVLGGLLAEFYQQAWWKEPSGLQGRMRARGGALIAETTALYGLVWTPEELTAWGALLDTAVPQLLTTIATERLLGNQHWVEYELTVELDEHIIHGRADLVIEVGPQMTLLDAKAGRSLGRYVDRNQLRLYALALKQTGRRPDRMGFWWLRHGKIVWIAVTPTTLEKFEEGVRGTLARWAVGDQTPLPGPHCTYCDFRADCPEGRSYYLTHSGSKLALESTGNIGNAPL